MTKLEEGSDVQKRVTQELIDSRVDDTIAYNDVDNNARISTQELFEATFQWNVLAYRYWSLRCIS